MLKKLAFAPIFLATFAIFIYQLSPVFKSYDFVFSLSSEIFIQLIIISALLSLSCFLFVISAALAPNIKITLGVGLLTSLLPFLFLEIGLAIVFSVGILISLFLSFVNLENSLKSYLTFNPGSIFIPSIKSLTGLLILSICIVYFLSGSKMIAQKGFQIPDSLIDTALKLNPIPESSNQETPFSQLSKEQIDLLKKNPNLLKQSGIDPKILNNLTSQNPVQETVKQTIKDQFQNIIKPYLGFVPALLSLLLFMTFQFIVSMTNLLIYPLLSLTFYVLEKSGYIKFETQQREVKKLVV